MSRFGASVTDEDATPGAPIAVQAFGDFQNFNPHLYIIATDRCFYGNGALVDSDISSKAFRKNWARLIYNIYNVDPLLCPKCQGSMKVIAFIEDDEIIAKILRHLGRWETRNHDPPAPNATHIPEIIYNVTYSQLPSIDYRFQ